jgi:hypothetical protein
MPMGIWESRVPVITEMDENITAVVNWSTVDIQAVVKSRGEEGLQTGCK